MSNDRDQEIVTSAISDTGSGLLEFLSALGQREAIAFGDGVSLPVRIKFDDLPKTAMPRSSSARFTERWQKSVGDEGFLEHIVERWRNSGSSHDEQSQGHFMADIPLADAHLHASPESTPAHHATPFHNGDAAKVVREPVPSPTRPSIRRDAAQQPAETAGALARPPLRRDPPQASPMQAGRPGSSTTSRREPAPVGTDALATELAPSQALRTLRDRIMQRQR